MQPGFSFGAAPVDPLAVSPTGESLPPVNATRRLSRHASYTGAVSASETRSANIVALRQLWREPRTINEIAAITGLPVSSVCSLKAALEHELDAVDLEVIEWGPGRKSTKRTRWRLRSEHG